MQKYDPEKLEPKWSRHKGGISPVDAGSTAMSNKYKPEIIENKWQEAWNKSGIYKTKDASQKPKFYALDMFPYPSGAGLHVGHPKGYTATDVVSRKKIMEGYSVLHPMGWDAFGLPTENYAIKNKIHPQVYTKKIIAVFKKQLEKFGFTYDWDREINTTDPEFYKWTQWIFLKMFEKGLAYQSDEPVNWCPSCKTVLANEDLEGGLCERCGTQVIQKKMKQWVLKMTAYADRLLYDLDTKNLDWEELIKEQQRNWIGRSEGATIKFKVQSEKLKVKKEYFIEVFTTRLDTIFGCTYCVVAPEHKLIADLKDKIENYGEVEKYIIQAQNKTEMERTALAKEKTGVELKGIKAINPFTDEEIPVWAADYVLGFYGTGAVMAVPAHDERDFEFANKYNLEIRKVIFHQWKSEESFTEEIFDRELLRRDQELSYYAGVSDGVQIIGMDNSTYCLGGRNLNLLEKATRKYFHGQSLHFVLYSQILPFCDDGVLVESGNYSKLSSEDAREEMAKWLEEKGIGKKKVNYKMRDWVFSRQRYWGEPIPIIHCAKCGAVGVPEKDLPVKLPDVKSYEPTGTGESPLAKITEWVNVKCPKCGGTAKRETNTMPQWAGSSWYYLAYVMRGISNFQFPISKYKEEFDKWLPVDLYVGGAEHATRHLLYARFWHKFLFDIGVVSTEEPFKKLFHVGLILAEDGRKMSKRWGNVINPDDVIREFGADSFRLYEMFMGPFSQSVSWSTKGVVGMRRFLERVWQLNDKCSVFAEASADKQISNVKADDKLERLLHKTIKKVGEDIEGFKFNTAISALMILSNEFEKHEKVSKDYFEKFLILLSPFAPHITEELWHNSGNKKSIFFGSWPKYDPSLVKEEEIELVIQINGKVKDKIKVAADISEDEAKKLALTSEKIKKAIENKEIKKVIFAKGRLINIVI